MKTIFNKVTDRMLRWVGLEFDFSFEMHGEPLNQITDHLFVGARPRPEDVDLLKEAGVTHVVSCLPEEDRFRVAFLEEDFHPLFLAVHDGIQQDITSLFPAFFAFATQAQESRADAKVLVHCEVGVSRSATLAIAFLMKSQGKGFLETFYQVRSKRPGVLPNIGFASQLQHFEHKLLPDVSTKGELSSLARYLKQICNVPVEVEVLQDMLERYNYDAERAIRSIFGDDIPRVVQGVRL